VAKQKQLSNSICSVIHFLVKTNVLLIEIHYQLGEG